VPRLVTFVYVPGGFTVVARYLAFTVTLIYGCITFALRYILYPAVVILFTLYRLCYHVVKADGLFWTGTLLPTRRLLYHIYRLPTACTYVDLRWLLPRLPFPVTRCWLHVYYTTVTLLHLRTPHTRWTVYGWIALFALYARILRLVTVWIRWLLVHHTVGFTLVVTFVTVTVCRLFCSPRSTLLRLPHDFAVYTATLRLVVTICLHLRFPFAVRLHVVGSRILHGLVGLPSVYGCPYTVYVAIYGYTLRLRCGCGCCCGYVTWFTFWCVTHVYRLPDACHYPRFIRLHTARTRVCLYVGLYTFWLFYGYTRYVAVPTVWTFWLVYAVGYGCCLLLLLRDFTKTVRPFCHLLRYVPHVCGDTLLHTRVTLLLTARCCYADLPLLFTCCCYGWFVVTHCRWLLLRLLVLFRYGLFGSAVGWLLLRSFPLRVCWFTLLRLPGWLTLVPHLRLIGTHIYRWHIARCCVTLIWLDVTRFTTAVHGYSTVVAVTGCPHGCCCCYHTRLCHYSYRCWFVLCCDLLFTVTTVTHHIYAFTCPRLPALRTLPRRLRSVGLLHITFTRFVCLLRFLLLPHVYYIVRLVTALYICCCSLPTVVNYGLRCRFGCCLHALTLRTIPRSVVTVTRLRLRCIDCCIVHTLVIVVCCCSRCCCYVVIVVAVVAIYTLDSWPDYVTLLIYTTLFRVLDYWLMLLPTRCCSWLRFIWIPVVTVTVTVVTVGSTCCYSDDCWLYVTRYVVLTLPFTYCTARLDIRLPHTTLPHTTHCYVVAHAFTHHCRYAHLHARCCVRRWLLLIGDLIRLYRLIAGVSRIVIVVVVRCCSGFVVGLLLWTTGYVTLIAVHACYVVQLLRLLLFTLRC